MASPTKRIDIYMRAMACVCIAALAGCDASKRGPGIASPEQAAATLEQYCSDCHNDAEYAGDMSIEHLDATAINTTPQTWESIVRKLRTRTMPPADAPRPPQSLSDNLAGWLEAELDNAHTPTPGAPTLRRLNRTEYGNAIRDLLDLDVDVAELLPPDDSAFGFDNIGDLLVFSPTLLDRYLSAADRISALAVGDTTTAAAAVTYTVRGDESQSLHSEGLPLGTVGGIVADHHFPLDAEYDISLGLFRNNLEVIRGLEHRHTIEIAIDGQRVFLGDVGGSAEADRQGTTINERSDATDARLRVRATVAAGPRRITATFIRKIAENTNRLRPFERSNAGTYDATGRPHVETLTVAGPFAASGPGDTPSRRRVHSCQPAGADDELICARNIIGTLARRAYRRPVADDDVERIMPFFESGRAYGGFDTGIQLALRRILASPSFVFRLEAEPESLQPGEAYAISDIELASRLSFFLWSSIPDDELLDLAQRNELSDPSVLQAQVRRMLTDSRASALTENFAGQWFHLRNLENIRPNTDAFPDFDNNLRRSFRRETELFFQSIVAEDRSILDLMNADYTFVDERLARHYGIPRIYGSHFRRVTLGPDRAERRGLLGKGGILMATSHADRTAPSLRGKWVLENLIGAPPPAPPANVPALETEPGEAPKTMRERLQMHRATPACAGCHQLLDPLGFALENFDAVGAWRTREAGRGIDASGLLADGTAVDGAIQLREALLADPQVFARVFVEKLLTYALGRGLQHYDMPLVREILRSTADGRYRLSDIVMGIVASAPFTMRTKAAISDADG